MMAEPEELRAGDKVRLVNLQRRSELNGLTGYVLAVDNVRNDGTTVDPSLAVLPGNKYAVLVHIPRNGSHERHRTDKPGVLRYSDEKKKYELRRENLQLIESSIQTALRNNNNNNMTAFDVGGATVASQAELDRRDPGAAGLIPAVMTGNVVRVREIMQHIQRTRGSPAADLNLDCAGNTALIGAIQHGQLEIVEVLLEYGASPNAKYGPLNPIMANSDVQALLLAIILMSTKKTPARQEIVFRLIEAGANVNASSATKGSVLFNACSGRVIPQDQWKFRLKLVKSLLINGAVPCQSSTDGGKVMVSPINHAASDAFWGSEENRIEVLQLLLEHGADPGEYEGTSTHGCSALHAAVSRRLWRVLEVLLQSPKGQAAVNVKMKDTDQENGCNPLYHALGDPKVESTHQTDARRCVALLLQYGADIHLPNAAGCPPYYGLTVTTTPKYMELRRLVDNVHGDVFEYWSSPEVQEWIGKVSSTRRQCPVCLVWSDTQRVHNQVEFKACARCGKQYYCSRKCQKAHWKQHKKACRAKS